MERLKCCIIDTYNMELEVLGSGNEVGRSALIIRDKKTEILMDCGVKLGPERPEYPNIYPKTLDACIISHAHLDHSGSTPIIFNKKKIPIYMNDVTLDLTTLLLKDSIKIGEKEGYGTPFSEKELKKMIDATKLINYEENFFVNDFTCRLYDSGHIPGSGSVFLNKNNKKILYTADIQTAESHLLNPCQMPKNIDTLIIESTYGIRDHPERKKEEQKLIDLVDEALARKEFAIVPVFAVGRAQEVLLILEEYADRIAIDGMAKTASEIIASYGAYIKDAERLRNILKKIKFVRSQKERERTLEERPIIVSSAGMMSGGPILHYLKEIRKREESKIVFTGFLMKDSPGRMLLQTKIFQNSKERFNVHCDIQQVELSAHADRSGLMEIIRNTEPQNVICVHGDNCIKFAKNIENETGINAIAPKNSEVVEL